MAKAEADASTSYSVAYAATAIAATSLTSYQATRINIGCLQGDGNDAGISDSLSSTIISGVKGAGLPGHKRFPAGNNLRTTNQTISTTVGVAKKQRSNINLDISAK